MVETSLWGGHNLLPSPLIGIGLTDLPKYDVVQSSSPHTFRCPLFIFGLWLRLCLKIPREIAPVRFNARKEDDKMQQLDTLIIFILFVCFFDISEARRGFPIFIEGFGDFLCRFFVSPVGECKIVCSSSYSKSNYFSKKKSPQSTGPIFL